ncbi:MAG: hypothetical protein V2I54_00470 [Bacteroidales bacterium]|jgi:hypothetical protein|nr:hypothetical protein [Bacteroidales bacterium]
MKNKYFKITKTISLAMLFAAIVNISNAATGENIQNICLECFEVDQEVELKLESSTLEEWMTNDEFWKMEKSEPMDLEEQHVDPADNGTGLESWMLDEDFWNMEESEERKYVIEPWMIDSNFWQI